MNRPRLRCSKCGRKPTVIELCDPEGLDERFDDSVRHMCPKCGEETLTFDMAGIWETDST